MSKKFILLSLVGLFLCLSCSKRQVTYINIPDDIYGRWISYGYQQMEQVIIKKDTIFYFVQEQCVDTFGYEILNKEKTKMQIWNMQGSWNHPGTPFRIYSYYPDYVAFEGENTALYPFLNHEFSRVK